MVGRWLAWPGCPLSAEDGREGGGRESKSIAHFRLILGARVGAGHFLPAQHLSALTNHSPTILGLYSWYVSIMWPGLGLGYSLLSYLEMRFYGKLLVAISLSDRQQFAGYDQSQTLLLHKIYGNCFLFRAIFHTE